MEQQRSQVSRTDLCLLVQHAMASASSSWRAGMKSLVADMLACVQAAEAAKEAAATREALAEARGQLTGSEARIDTVNRAASQAEAQADNLKDLLADAKAEIKTLRAQADESDAEYRQVLPCCRFPPKSALAVVSSHATCSMMANATGRLCQNPARPCAVMAFATYTPCITMTPLAADAPGTEREAAWAPSALQRSGNSACQRRAGGRGAAKRP